MANADRSAEQFRKMTETPIPKLILSLAAPTILSMLITSIYNLADTFFVGQISTSASGAVGIVSSLMAILQALGFMLGHGSGSIISRSLGSQNTDAATRFASTSFFTALVFGGIITVAGLLTLPDFMMLLGSTETILPHACAYARYILLAAPIMMSSLVMNNILRYEGKASFAMIGLVTGGLLNIALDPLFIFGLGMGTAGAGLATALSQTISFCILLSMFLRGKTVSQFRITAVTHSPAEFGTILMTGMPSFGRQGLNSIGGMLLNIAARSYGDAAVAGMSIVSRIFMFIISVAIGTGQGFQPVAGYQFGAENKKKLKQAFIFTLWSSIIAAAGIGLAGFLFAPMTMSFFLKEDMAAQIGIFTFRSQCLILPLIPIGILSNMLFQGIGQQGKAAFLSACRQGIVFLPLIFLLSEWIGLAGVEIAQALSDGLTAIISIPFVFYYFQKSEKKRTKKQTSDGKRQL